MVQLKTPLTLDDHRLGDPDAPVVLLEYGDYQCPFCGAAQPIVQTLLKSFGADLALVFRHFPLAEAHLLAPAAAQTAEFAADHDRFWEMHEALYANQSRLGLPLFMALAEGMGLSRAGLQEALESGRYAPRVREHFMSGVRNGVNGTPCFFINGVRHDGGWELDELAAAINAARRAPPAGRTLAHGSRP